MAAILSRGEWVNTNDIILRRYILPVYHSKDDYLF